MALRTVGVKLAAEVSGYVNSLRTAGGATKDFVGELDKAARAGHLDAVADQAGRVGLGLAGVAVAAVAMAARFDKQMSSVAAATHASASELEQLRAAAIQAGKDTAYSATEAAKGIEELSKAGVSTADVLGGGLKGALALAAAGELDVGEAAETAASAMTQFKLDGRDVGHIADLLAAGAGKAQGTVHDMGMALSQSGLVASQFGLSVEDTVGTLTAFANAGLMGSDAGTSLKTALLMLANPSKESRSLMEELGISAYDLQGRFIGISELAGQLRQRLGGLTQEQRNQALATIFGADAIRAASILYEQGADGIDKFRAAVDDQGYAAETARAKTDNLVGDIERLKGSLETMAIEAGGGANGGLRILTQGANALVDQLGAMPPAVGSTVTVLAGLSGAAMLAFAGWAKMRSAMADALDELRQTGPVGERAARGLEATTKWAGRAAIAFASLQIAGVVMSQFSDSATDLDALNRSLERFVKYGDLSGELTRQFGDNLEDVGQHMAAAGDGWFPRLNRSIEALIPPTKEFNELIYGGSFTGDVERFRALDSAMADMVASGNLDKARELYGQLLTASGGSADELDRLLPKFTDASFKAQTTGESAKGAAGGITEVGAAASKTAEEVDKLAKQFDGLFKVQMDIDEATIAYKQGIVDLKKELVDGKRTLDTDTAAGRDNASAVLDQIKRIKELRDSRYALNGNLDEANAKYSQDIAGLRSTLLQLGYNKEAVDQLIGSYQNLPGEASTEVSAPGAAAAKAQVENFNFAIKNVPPSKTVPFWASTSEATAAVNALKAKINELKNKKIYIEGSVRWTSSGDLKVPGGTLVKNERGGVYEHAAVGVLREAQIASPMGPARYAWAEPATGGEAFIPRFGDPARSLGILETAAGWYGRTLASQPPVYVSMAGGSGGTQTHRVVIEWPDGQVAGEILFAGFTGAGAPRAMAGWRKGVTRAGGNPKAVDR